LSFKATSHQPPVQQPSSPTLAKPTTNEKGESLGGGISRFQAVAVGDTIYIHTHRCSDHIIALDVSTSPPTLARRPTVADAKAGAPSARGLHSVTRVGDALYLFGGAPQSGAMVRFVFFVAVVFCGLCCGPQKTANPCLSMGNSFISPTPLPKQTNNS
jgi:hypothetical protein